MSKRSDYRRLPGRRWGLFGNSALFFDVVLSRYDTTAGERVKVKRAFFNMNAPIADYTEVALALEELDAGDPDTLAINIMAAHPMLMAPGNDVLFDDMAFAYADNSITDTRTIASLEQDLKIGRMAGKVTFTTSQDVKIAVYNLAGQKLSGTLPAEGTTHTWDTTGQARGVYFIKLEKEGLEFSRAFLLAE